MNGDGRWRRQTVTEKTDGNCGLGWSFIQGFRKTENRTESASDLASLPLSLSGGCSLSGRVNGELHVTTRHIKGKSNMVECDAQALALYETQVSSVCIGKMVVHVPFLRWDSVGNPSATSSGIAFYYLETAGGEQVIAALALRTEDNRLIYRASNEFVEEYQELLHLGTVAEWHYVFQLNAWLDDIVYHSFVLHSSAGVASFWYVKALSMPTVVERLPRALCQYFPSDGLSTWILVRHGLKAWPVEVVNCEFRRGWDDFCQAHELQFEHKLILACERK